MSWWNEYYANSQSPAEKELWWRQERTAARIWRDEYRNGPNAAKLGHIRLAICATAVGNDIPLQSAQTAVQYDCIVDYHPYTKWVNGVRDAGDWQYLSGRWVAMDNMFRTNGYAVNWFFGECGPYQSAATGWRHSSCLGGNVEAYMSAMDTWLREVAGTLAFSQGRVLGLAVFTTGGGSQWQWFETAQPELNRLAGIVSNVWNQPTPPPQTTWQDEVWQESVVRQTISLNPNASLQAAIFADGFTPVQSEFWYTASDGVRRACQAAENVADGRRRVYYAVVPNWNDVRWFSNQPSEQLVWDSWPTDHEVITQPFGADPVYYGQFGLPGHEGLDIRAPGGSPIKSVWDGEVVYVQTNPSAHAYGIHVRVETGQFTVIYGHMQSVSVAVGQMVNAGDVLGLADNTGNSRASHLHLTMKHEDAYPGGPMYIGYPHNIIDPTPYAVDNMQ